MDQQPEWGKYNVNDSVNDYLRRYCQLDAASLHALQQGLENRLAEARKAELSEVRGFLIQHNIKRRITATDQLLEWAPYEWNYDYILRSTVLRKYADITLSMLSQWPEISGDRLWIEVAGWKNFDVDKREKAVSKYLKYHPDVSETRARWMQNAKGKDLDAAKSAPRNAFRKAGLSASTTDQQEFRQELEKMSKAILWLTQTE